MKIWFIGLGMIGSQMAMNLQNDRRSQVLLSRSRDEVEALNDAGLISDRAKRNSFLRGPVLNSRRKLDTKSKSGLCT